MKHVSPSIEFLDDICSVDRYTNGWNLIRTINFGFWVYQDEPEKVLRKISYEEIESWEKNKNIQVIPYDKETVSQVRNICGTKFKLTYPDKISIPFWLNVVYPKDQPLDLRTVKVEAYNNENTAIIDADAERESSDKNRVFTKKIETEIVDITDYIKEDTLKVSDYRGLVEIEVVREYIDENRYLRKTLREMLKLIPKNKLTEFNQKLDTPIQKGVDQDGLEEDFEQDFVRVGKLIDKAYDIFEKARPPVEVLPPNNSPTAMDRDLWYGKRDTILSQLMEYSIKNQPTTLASLRDKK